MTGAGGDDLGHGGAGVGHVQRMAHGVADRRRGPALGVARRLPDDVPLRDDPGGCVPFEHHQTADRVLGEQAGGLAKCGRRGHTLHAAGHVVGDAQRGGVLGDAGRGRQEIVAHAGVSAPTLQNLSRTAFP